MRQPRARAQWQASPTGYKPVNGQALRIIKLVFAGDSPPPGITRADIIRWSQDIDWRYGNSFVKETI